MERHYIKQTSPPQIKSFLCSNEQVMYIGAAKELITGSIDIIEKQRWIALTDLGRLLIMSNAGEGGSRTRSRATSTGSKTSTEGPIKSRKRSMSNPVEKVDLKENSVYYSISRSIKNSRSNSNASETNEEESYSPRSRLVSFTENNQVIQEEFKFISMDTKERKSISLDNTVSLINIGITRRIAISEIHSNQLKKYFLLQQWHCNDYYCSF